MKAIVAITDSEAMKSFERAFIESGERGFTIVPAVLGGGEQASRPGR